MLEFTKKILLVFFVFVIPFAVKGNSDTLKEEHIHMIAEIAPQFPGGEDSLRMFIRWNLRYPAQGGLPEEGTVFVTFVVEIDGSLSNIEVLRGLHGALDPEAIRVVKLMPNWIPGKTRGKAVRTRFIMPIRFDIRHWR